MKKINKIHKLLARLTRGHRDSIQINKIRNEKEDITEIEEITKIISSYYKSLYLTKLENLDEMENFLDRYQVPKLNQDQINDLKSPISPKEIEAVISSLPTKKNPRTRWVYCRVISDLQRRPNSNSTQTSHKIETEGTNSFYEATVTLIPKPHKDLTKKENFRLISLMDINAKNTQ